MLRKRKILHGRGGLTLLCRGKERKTPHQGYLLYPTLSTKVGRVVLYRIGTLSRY